MCPAGESQITDSEMVASFNWIDTAKEPTILMPGA